MEFKAWQGELKAVESGPGGFVGYGSLFGVLDDGGDVVDSGAFTSAIDDFLHHGFIADGHNWDSVSAGAIGTIVEAKEDEHGLWLKTEYHSTPVAQAARTIAQERMARGKSVGLSIGYSVEPGGFKFDDKGVRHLQKLKLFEVSQVNVPMLRQAGLVAVKGFGIPFEDHSDNLRVAVEEWLERVKSGLDVRLKEGRPISEARRGRMAAVKDSLLAGVAEIDALLTETAPRPKDEPVPDEVKAEVVEAAKAIDIDPELLKLRLDIERLVSMHSRG